MSQLNMIRSPLYLVAFYLVLFLNRGDAFEVGLLERLMRVNTDLLTGEKRCEAYEQVLRAGDNWQSLAKVPRDVLFQVAFDRLSDSATLSSEQRKVLVYVRMCLSHEPAELEVPDNRLALDGPQLSILSKVQQDTKAFPLDQRCKVFDETLRRLLYGGTGHEQLVYPSKPELFQRAMTALVLRKKNFNPDQPVYLALEECVNNLSEYRSSGMLKHQVFTSPDQTTSIHPVQNETLMGSTIERNLKATERAFFGNHLAGSNYVGHGEHYVHSEHQNENNFPYPADTLTGPQLRAAYEELWHRFNATDARMRLFESQLEHEKRRESHLEAKLIKLRAKLQPAGHHGGRDHDTIFGKLAKDNKKEWKLKDDDKIYNDPVDIARKLQRTLNAYEALENRCQKYYIAINHPGKVTKKFIRLIAKLNLPRTMITDGAYYEFLDEYLQLLNRSADKSSRLAARDLEQCLINFSNGPSAAESMHYYQDEPHQQVHMRDSRGRHMYAPTTIDGHHSGPHEIPVEFVDKRNPRVVHNWSYDRSSAVGTSQTHDFPPFPHDSFYN